VYDSIKGVYNLAIFIGILVIPTASITVANAEAKK
jgi:hypothetical protein